jgi:hypothetical protein
MPIIYKITKYILNLVFIILLVSCGGGSDSKPTHLIFPEHLPEVNPNLSQDSSEGIWMVHRTIDVTYIGYEDGIKQDMSLQSIENGISILKSYNSETSTLPFCTIQDMFEQFELEISPTKDGYRQSYSTNPNNISVPSEGNLEITFINNNKLVGRGHRKYTYTNGSRHELITTYAVKISDDTNLNASGNLSYSSHIETESDLEVDIPAICIALSSFDATHYSDGKKTSNNHVQYAQIIGLGEYNPHGTEIFNTKATSEKDEYQRIGGIYYNGHNYDEWKKNILCPLEDTACLAQGTLDLNIIKNNSTGIAFSSRLNTSDGSFLNTEVSLIIDSIINEK